MSVPLEVGPDDDDEDDVVVYDDDEVVSDVKNHLRVSSSRQDLPEKEGTRRLGPTKLKIKVAIKDEGQNLYPNRE